MHARTSSGVGRIFSRCKCWTCEQRSWRREAPSARNVAQRPRREAPSARSAESRQSAESGGGVWGGGGELKIFEILKVQRCNLVFWKCNFDLINHVASRVSHGARQQIK